MLQTQTPITVFRGHHFFLSNFYPTANGERHQGIVWLELPEDKTLYPSVEHAFQAAKTLDTTLRGRISRAETPAKARYLGRCATVLRPDWENVKLQVMEGLLRQKFDIPELRHYLLATLKRPLIHENHWNDRFWGVCGGEGQNKLGELLMKIRNELAEAAET